MITVLFQTESHFPVDRKKVKAAIVEVLTSRLTSSAEVSIIVVGDRRMHELNLNYRKKDHTTDVLSFPQSDPSQQMAPFVDMPDGIMRLGDIVVSFPEAVREATEENKMVDDKIVELVLHGLDHLMGMHHPE
jgi:probable rRNA maturation factor